MGFIELFDGIYRAFRFSLLLRLMIELVLTDYSTKCYIHEYVFYHVVVQFGFYRPKSKMISEKKKKEEEKSSYFLHGQLACNDTSYCISLHHIFVEVHNARPTDLPRKWGSSILSCYFWLWQPFNLWPIKLVVKRSMCWLCHVNSVHAKRGNGLKDRQFLLSGRWSECFQHSMLWFLVDELDGRIWSGVSQGLDLRHTFGPVWLSLFMHH